MEPRDENEKGSGVCLRHIVFLCNLSPLFAFAVVVFCFCFFISFVRFFSFASTRPGSIVIPFDFVWKYLSSIVIETHHHHHRERRLQSTDPVRNRTDKRHKRNRKKNGRRKRETVHE